MATVTAILLMVTDIWDMLVTMVTHMEPTIHMPMVTVDMVTLTLVTMVMVMHLTDITSPTGSHITQKPTVTSQLILNLSSEETLL